MEKIAPLGRSTAFLAVLSGLAGGVALWTHSDLAALSFTCFASLLILQILNRLAFFFPTPIARTIHWIYSLVFEAFAVVTSLLLRRFQSLKGQNKTKAPSSNGRPILLIHGYLHDGSAWVYLRYFLQKEKKGPVYTLNLGHPFQSIRQHAQKVEQLAEKIEKEAGRRDLILIGHSMGGLVSSYYATQLAPKGKVTDVITIGSPLSGTAMARIGVGRCSREMEMGSPFTQELQKEISLSKQTRFYHIATRTDLLVIPHTSALGKGESSQKFLMEDIGHLSLLFSPRVAHQIASWLPN